MIFRDINELRSMMTKEQKEKAASDFEKFYGKYRNMEPITLVSTDPNDINLVKKIETDFKECEDCKGDGRVCHFSYYLDENGDSIDDCEMCPTCEGNGFINK